MPTEANPTPFRSPLPSGPYSWPQQWPWDSAGNSPDEGRRFSIEAFKSAAARRGLAKGFFFKCHFFGEIRGIDPMDPSGGWILNRDTAYFCRSATLPAAIVQAVELKYHTRSIKIAGAREVQPFTCTFFNTINGEFRRTILKWQENVSTYRATNKKTTAPVSYYGTIYLDHYDIGGEPQIAFIDAGIAGRIPTLLASAEHNLIGRYIMTHVWPSSVGAPAFSQDNEEFQTFDVTFEHLDLEYVSREELKGR